MIHPDERLELPLRGEDGGEETREDGRVSRVRELLGKIPVPRTKRDRLYASIAGAVLLVILVGAIASSPSSSGAGYPEEQETNEVQERVQALFDEQEAEREPLLDAIAPRCPFDSRDGIVAIAEAAKQVLQADGYGYSETANTLIRRSHEWLVASDRVMRTGESCDVVFATVIHGLKLG